MLAVDDARDRVAEVGWTLDYLYDLEADFWVHYGVDDMLALPGRQFLRLAQRTVAYRGVMRERARALSEAEEPADAPAQRAPMSAPTSAPVQASAPGVREVPGTADALRSDPILSSCIEVG